MIYIVIVSKLIEQRMHEILLRINDNASLESVPTASTERYLKREKLITYRRSRAGEVSLSSPCQETRCSRNNELGREWSQCEWNFSAADNSRITCRKCPIRGNDARSAYVHLHIAHRELISKLRKVLHFGAADDESTPMPHAVCTSYWRLCWWIFSISIFSRQSRRKIMKINRLITSDDKWGERGRR